ncbi:hypothetical protein J9303_06565 [Bacillaceae bacterium Marseille-Q3522]|nr:hypothetical protein [Bacillaceae bacterium Marseille-Q3522]
MDKRSKEMRSSVFREELETLKMRNYISGTDFTKISSAYDSYIHDLNMEQERIRNQEKKTVPAVQPKPVVQQQKQMPKTQPVKQKKTAEQLRERNLSIILVVGVISLLFGGLILATTGWYFMSEHLKVLSISMISVVFFAMSFIAMKLKITQTAFAFLTLASFFVPIAFLSAAYYQLFGEYLSLTGEGRWLLGVFVGILCFALYMKIAAFFKSKAFTIFTLSTFSITVIFGLLYISPSADWFSFLLVLFNILFLSNIDRLRDEKRLKLFKTCLYSYFQFKLAVESFVIFVFFSGSFLYSIVLLLAAGLLFMMSLRFHTFYHFAFSVIFSYGYVHLLGNLPFHLLDSLFIALLPAIFFMLSIKLKKRKPFFAESFKYTAVAVSLPVFLYMQVAAFFQGFYAETAMALTILAALYIWITMDVKQKAYTFPAVFFLTLSVFHFGVSLNFTNLQQNWLLFIFSTVIYFGLYLFNRAKALKIFALSAVVIPCTVVFLLILDALLVKEWLLLSIWFFIIACAFFITYRQDDSFGRTAGIYGFPISLLLALSTIYGVIGDLSKWYTDQIYLSGHFTGVAFVLLACALACKKWNLKDFFNPFFISALFSYLIAFISLFNIFESHSDMYWTLIFLAGILISGLSVYVYRFGPLWLAVTLFSGLTYLPLGGIIAPNNHSFLAAYFLFGGLFFLLVTEMVAKFSRTGRLYFFWFSHLVNFIAITWVFPVVALGLAGPPLWYIFPVAVYIISAKKAKKTWEKYLFTYAGFTAFSILLFLYSDTFTEMHVTHSVIATAIVAFGFWFFSGDQWKKMYEYYLISVLNFSIFVYIIEGSMPFRLFDVLFVTLIVIFTSYLLHQNKWDIFNGVAFTLSFNIYVLYFLSEDIWIGSIFHLLLIILLLAASRHFYFSIFQKAKPFPAFDWYRVFALIYVLVLISQITDRTDGLFPELFASSTLPVYFVILRTKTGWFIEKKVYDVLLVTSAFYPYFVLFDYIAVPDVLKTEMVCLPFLIAATILLRKIFYVAQVSARIEIGVVALFFLIFIADANWSHTIYDAIIIGTISLIAMVIGFVLKYKSYFLAGTITILLNIFINTEPFWGSLPWWLYLIIGGIALIGTASFFEWKKQKTKITSGDWLKKQKAKINHWFRKWN